MEGSGPGTYADMEVSVATELVQKRPQSVFQSRTRRFRPARRDAPLVELLGDLETPGAGQYTPTHKRDMQRRTLDESMSAVSLPGRRRGGGGVPERCVLVHRPPTQRAAGSTRPASSPPEPAPGMRAPAPAGAVRAAPSETRARSRGGFGTRVSRFGDERRQAVSEGPGPGAYDAPSAIRAPRGPAPRRGDSMGRATFGSLDLRFKSDTNDYRGTRATGDAVGPGAYGRGHSSLIRKTYNVRLAGGLRRVRQRPATAGKMAAAPAAPPRVAAASAARARK